MFRCSVCNRRSLFHARVGKHRLCKRCSKSFEPIIDATIRLKEILTISLKKGV